MKVEIDVIAPDGYEFVRHGKPCKNEFVSVIPNPQWNEMSLVSAGQLYLYNQTKYEYFIFRKKEPYKFPSFVKKGLWLAMDAGGTWRLYYSKPVRNVNSWSGGSGNLIVNGQISSIYMDFPLPDCSISNWEESLIQNI